MLNESLNMPARAAPYRFRDQMRLWVPPREVIQKLAFLSATRQRLIQAHNLLAVPVYEQETFVGRSLQKTLKSNVKKSLAALKEEQKIIDQQIHQLIQADFRLKELFELMISVPGIGPVIATEFLIATNEMQTIDDPKKLACHAGVAPFEYRSGSSIRGKTRVSHQARKRLKSLLHMAGPPVRHHVSHSGEGRSSGLLPTQVRRGQAYDAGFERGAQQAHSSGLCGGASG